jgi:hypothetical protein
VDNQHRKISGYRELDEAEIALMNAIKAHGAAFEVLLADLRKADPDPRWVNIGMTHIQQGLMALTRAVAKPTFF